MLMADPELHRCTPSRLKEMEVRCRVCGVTRDEASAGAIAPDHTHEFLVPWDDSMMAPPKPVVYAEMLVRFQSDDRGRTWSFCTMNTLDGAYEGERVYRLKVPVPQEVLLKELDGEAEFVGEGTAPKKTGGE
jgi:hypothetical protein